MQFTLLCLPVIPVSLALEPGPFFGELAALQPVGWVALTTLFFGVFYVGNYTYQRVLRRIGAPQTSLFMPIRLISAFAFSFLFLGEALRSWLEAAGMALVLATISWCGAGPPSSLIPTSTPTAIIIICALDLLASRMMSSRRFLHPWVNRDWPQ